MAAESRLVCRAPAKVNLTLRVLGRRADGHHDLESLVAFAGAHDTLSLLPANDLSLTVSGPRAGDAGATADNLVLKAAVNLRSRLAGLRTGRFHLVKRLPAGAGLGGGSSDAAAALRLLARLNRIDPEHPALAEAALATGADVPVCLARQTVVMRGIGERLEPVTGFARRFAVLVFPGVPTATREVFQALDLKPGERLPKGGVDPCDLFACGNDLTGAAVRVTPAIGIALAAIAESGASVSRMSGSGSCCFGLYPDCKAATAAARRIARRYPGWWIKSSAIG
jgi:4-diphosphocytidyl-2-C-methyl-D-erythritol kinase